MNPEAIAKARDRLEIAVEALDGIKAATSTKELAKPWFLFLTGFKGVFTTLEQGSKASDAAKQWYGGKVRERKDDPLVSYFFHARNAEEHGLAPTTRMSPGRKLFRTEGGKEYRFLGDSITGPTMIGPDGHIVPPIAAMPAGPALIPVKDQQGNVYGPPIMHQGADIEDLTPAGTASLALAYIQQMVAEAEGLT